MAKETKSTTEEKLALELGDPTRRVTFLRDKIESIRDGLIRAHNKLPDAARDKPGWNGINRAIDDLTELMSLSDLAEHLATKT